LISEAIQLENMIFSSKPFNPLSHTFKIDPSEYSDWALRFCEMKDATFDEDGKPT